MKIAVVANSAWYVANFRLQLMSALRADGHDVVAVSAPGEDVSRVVAAGFPHFAIPFSGRGLDPLKELATLRALRSALRRMRIELVLSYTPKGNIYAAFARVGMTCRQMANVSGLGSSFIRNDWLSRLVHVLYRIAFRRVDWVFFQNRDDRRLFTEGRLVAANCSERIPGSGVDLRHFAMTPMPEPRSFEETVFLLIARVLRDKGICEYAEAAARIRSKYPATRFQLLGQLGADNPSAIAPRQLQGWIDSGVIEYLGHHADVRPYIEAAACVVLPSYREGLPRTLLEAGAMGRPIIATDVAGCRDTIDDGINGYLCRVRDVDSLTDTLARFIALPSEHRSRMGQSSRRKMEAEFDESVVISRYLDLVRRLDRGRWNCVGQAD